MCTALDAAGGSIRDEYVSIGSGSLFAYGVLEDHYKKDMSEDDAVNLAIRGLNAAMRAGLRQRRRLWR